MSRAASSRSKSQRGRTRFAPRADVGAGRSASNPQEIAEMIRRYMGGSGVAVSERNAMCVGTVYACVRILAESVALLPLRIFETTNRGEDAELAPEHPLDRLFRLRPSRAHTSFEYKRLMMTHLLLAGNHYALIRRVGSEVRELLPFLNPRSMEVKQGPDLQLVYEYEGADGRKKKYRSDEVFHLRALNTDGLVGLSVISAAAQAIGVALQAEKHGANILKNGANVGGVLEHPQQLSAEAAKRLRESFDGVYGGSDNAGRTVLLEEGLKFSKIGMTASESQFIESRKFQRSDIGMFFGVPPHMYGDIERGTSWGSGIEQQGVGFVTYTLLPWLTNITQGVNCSLLSDAEQDQFHAQFDTEPLTRADFLTRQNGSEVMLRNGALSPNEWRRREGLAPYDGGNEFAKINGSTGAQDNGAQDNGKEGSASGAEDPTSAPDTKAQAAQRRTSTRRGAERPADQRAH